MLGPYGENESTKKQNWFDIVEMLLKGGSDKNKTIKTQFGRDMYGKDEYVDKAISSFVKLYDVKMKALFD